MVRLYRKFGEKKLQVYDLNCRYYKYTIKNNEFHCVKAVKALSKLLVMLKQQNCNFMIHRVHWIILYILREANQ